MENAIKKTNNLHKETSPVLKHTPPVKGNTFAYRVQGTGPAGCDEITFLMGRTEAGFMDKRVVVDGNVMAQRF